MVAAFFHPEVRGLRVLLVEDNFLVAAQLRSILIDLGAEVVGPVPSVEAGVALAQDEELDGAILDINIRGESCERIAAALIERGRPFFFITGYASPEFHSERLKDVRRLLKPVDREMLLRSIRAEIVGKRS